MRRPTLAVLLALCLAVPTQAQTSRFVDTWLIGADGPEWAKALRLGVSENNVGWGTAVAKGYEPFLEIRRVNGSALYATITGAWEDTNEAAALFAIGQATCLAPAVGTDYVEYYAVLVMKKPGSRSYIAADGHRQPFRFRVERWP
jgi:hypothetical protein